LLRISDAINLGFHKHVPLVLLTRNTDNGAALQSHLSSSNVLID